MAATASVATISIIKTNVAIDPIAAQADVLSPTSVTGGFFLNATGSVGGVRRSPYDTILGLADTGKYNSVQGGGTQTYSFAQTQNSFSILWGSPDSYNTLAFFLGGTQVDLSHAAGVSGKAITGSEVAMLPLLQPQAVGLAQVVFSGFLFDQAVLSSGKNAFEYGLVAATPVPLPAAVWMLAAALGSLGLMRRRAAA